MFALVLLSFACNESDNDADDRRTLSSTALDHDGGAQLGTDPDVCSLPVDIGQGDAAGTAYYFDTETGTCEPFNYGGFGGNENRFGSEEKCLAFCGDEFPNFCLLPVDVGEGNGSTTFYYFDTETGTCEPFNYGGFGGNGNRFMSEERCLAFCGDISPDAHGDAGAS